MVVLAAAPDSEEEAAAAAPVECNVDSVELALGS